MNEKIYLDCAATTPVDDEVLQAALPYYKELFYNPSSTHAAGQKVAAAVERARERCAAAINADPSEIFFTSGGTEAVNWAMSAMPVGKTHAVVSAIEHDSVLACAERLKSRGYAVDYVKPDSHGIITPDAVKSLFRADTGLVCVMAVNNIVGSVQPIAQLASVAHSAGALFFTDAVQAVNSLDIDVKEWGADMIAVSAHKFYSLKGAGFLYVKKGVKPAPLLIGGEQERGLRAGTVDVPSVVAMGAAIEKAQAGAREYNEHVKAVKTEFLKTLEVGRPVECARSADDIVSVVFDGINGGRLAVALSCAGVCASVGAACSAGSATPPKTLIEMGVKNADCSVRFSFGRCVSVEQANAAARIVNEVASRLI